MRVTLVELPEYIRDAGRLLDEESQDELRSFLSLNPRAGSRMAGTGGVRKLRWARAGSGKSGGVRVIYYFYNETIPLFLLNVFGKNEKANLSKAERNKMAKLVSILVETYGGKKMSEAFKRIEKSLEDAIAFAEGQNIAARVYKPSRVDVKRLRKSLRMTQAQFAGAFGIGLGTLRHWERGDRAPKGAALVLLNMLSKEPKTVLRILGQKAP